MDRIDGLGGESKTVDGGEEDRFEVMIVGLEIGVRNAAIVAGSKIATQDDQPEEE
ncbi:MAG: hypothetical protein ABL888_18410 [Pirellulaceae bacterium]